MLAREYLREHGYTKTSEALREEVGKGLERLELADNVDLGSVVREFEAYYAMRLGKPPRLTRRRANDENDLPAPPRRRKGGSTAASAPAPASANAQPAKPRAGKEREIPNFYLGRFPLVSADCWTSDHLSKRGCFFPERARGTLALKRRRTTFFSPRRSPGRRASPSRSA